MPVPFLTRSVNLITADGALETLVVRQLAAAPLTVLLARERCRFELLRPPQGLRPSAALAAARISAQARTPYDEAGGCLTRRGGLFGLWWWDQAWVAQQLVRHGLPEDARVLPETLAQPEGDGWRVVRDSSGYEAQVWDGGFLTGSVWRRRPFDAQAWSAFVRVGPEAAAPSPDDPPPAQRLPYTWRSAYRRDLVSAPSPGDLAPLGLFGVAMLLVGVTAVLIGQGLRLQAEHRRVEGELAAAEARPQLNRRPRLMAETQDLRGLQAVLSQPDPIVMVDRVQKILTPFGLKISAFQADRRELTVTVPAEAIAGIDLLTEELEASREFTDVRPSLDRAKRELTIKVSMRR